MPLNEIKCRQGHRNTKFKKSQIQMILLSTTPLKIHSPLSLHLHLYKLPYRSTRVLFHRNFATANKSSPSQREIVRLLSLAKPHSKLLFSAIGLLFISSAVTMSVPFTMGRIIDFVTFEMSGTSHSHQTTSETNETNESLNADKPSLTTRFALLIGVFTVGAAANTGRFYLFKCAGERIISNLRFKLFQNILKQDLAFHDRNASGELISRLSTDTVRVLFCQILV